MRRSRSSAGQEFDPEADIFELSVVAAKWIQTEVTRVQMTRERDGHRTHDRSVRETLEFHFIAVSVEEEVPLPSIFAGSDAEFGHASIHVSAAVKHHSDHFLAAAEVQL